MSYDGTFKKINIRSPYFITVAKAPSKLEDGDTDTDTGEEQDTIPTSPISSIQLIRCGDTISSPVGAEILKYNIDISSKTVGGTFEVNFTDIREPIKFKLGFPSDNTKTFTEKGLDAYSSAWEAVGGTASNLSPTVGNASYGWDAITHQLDYTLIQSDIDSYGATDDNKIQLEIQRPLGASANFSLNCPAIVSDDAASTTGFALAVGLIVKQQKTKINTTISLNGTSLGSGSTKDTTKEAKRYYFNDTTLSAINAPESIQNKEFFRTSQSYNGYGFLEYDVNDVNYTLDKKALSIVNPTGVNKLEVFATGMGAGDYMPVIVQIARIKVVWTNFFGNYNTNNIETIEVPFTLSSEYNKAEIYFIGSNKTLLDLPTGDVYSQALKGSAGEKQTLTPVEKTYRYKH